MTISLKRPVTLASDQQERIDKALRRTGQKFSDKARALMLQWADGVNHDHELAEAQLKAVANG